MSEIAYLTPEEVAERWRVNPGTVRQWIQHRGLPALRIGGRHLRIDPAALEQWLRAQDGPRPRHRPEPEQAVADDRQAELPLEQDRVLQLVLEEAKP